MLLGIDKKCRSKIRSKNLDYAYVCEEERKIRMSHIFTGFPVQFFLLAAYTHRPIRPAK